ncbi:7-cyano-7-deazaguanine synthase [Bradyrhizobium erythrophlei]|uniref:7-cyano-7-deazaguanine synthase n=1 Tax=Bradyrhizobium erythrophlei TaxID=1437360 RepID=UPI0009A8D20F|nr:7-cyano-7-deazaguanine synthase [Bradyrhizobium erythrophlei]
MKVLLFSGGLDSSALASWKRPDVCLTIDYGQRPASGEIAAAKAICDELRIRHELLTVDLRALGSGSLGGKPQSSLAQAEEWWPYRNQMLITLVVFRRNECCASLLKFGQAETRRALALSRSQTSPTSVTSRT